VLEKKYVYIACSIRKRILWNTLLKYYFCYILAHSKKIKGISLNKIRWESHYPFLVWGSKNWKYVLQNFLELMKDYNNSKSSNYKREKILQLKSLFCLMLGSLRSSEKWILFFIDRMNVKLLWNFSPWITDGVAQLLSNKISKRFGQNMNSASLCKRVSWTLFFMPIFLSWKFWPLFNSSSSYL